MRRSKNIKLAKKKADSYFSKFIRMRDLGKKCCTCNDILRSLTQYDAGHFITRDNGHVRYDEQNVHGQCISCNRFKSGKQYEHGLFIDQTYGEGTAEKLLIKSKMPGRKRTHYDYEEIANKYAQKIKELN